MVMMLKLTLMVIDADDDGDADGDADAEANVEANVEEGWVLANN